MCNLEHFKIDLKGLAEEQTPLEYQLGDDFFKQLGSTEVQGGALHVSGSIRKAVGFFELQLAISGTVRITCDRCLDLMDQPIEAKLQQVVKLGTVDDNEAWQGGSYAEQDDIIIVDEDKAVLDTAWLIYESVVLAVPIQHVHQPGDCNVAMSEKLNELSAARSSDADAGETIDPRWEALKNLKIKN